MFTSRDVARLANVSQSTVSYVMSGKRPISRKTRERVEAAIEQLTYQPNAGARALAGQRTQVVGLVIPMGAGSDTTGLLPFIETIAACARQRDHDVLLVTADEGAAVLTRLSGRSQCDAIIVMDVEAADARVPVAAELRVPVLLIGVPDDPQGLPCVDLDFERAAHLAIGEIVGCGHRRVVIIGHEEHVIARGINYVGRFERGARQAAEQFGVDLEFVTPVAATREGGRDAVERALAVGGSRPGLVLPYAPAVPWVLQALGERGMVPGRDVSVVGLVTDAMAESTSPPVTNVSMEPRSVSRLAMTTLFDVLDGRADPPTAPVLVEPALTRRETTILVH